ncbi:hypothetical protein ACFQ1I_29535 [Kitasatospora arboriphila]
MVRTLDPNPDHSPKPPKDPRSGHVYLDHQDHTYSAYFAQAALARHWAATGRGTPPSSTTSAT